MGHYKIKPGQNPGLKYFLIFRRKGLANFYIIVYTIVVPKRGRKGNIEMKIDRQYFEEHELNGKKLFSFRKVNEAVGAYECPGETILFEIATDERIGYIRESDIRASRNRYYNAGCLFGWDGNSKSKKEYVKRLCTKADYRMAESLLMEEYKNRKNKEA